MFIIYTRYSGRPVCHGIIGCLLQDIECSLYVDDFLICYRAKHMHSIEKQLNICLDTNGFKFSKKKTVCMHFCQLRKLHLDPSLFLDGEPVPVVKEHKFLGLGFYLIIPGICLAQFSLSNVHKRGLKHHHFIYIISVIINEILIKFIS